MNTVCLEPGCDEPRMVSKAGKTLQRCEYHQREKWRQTARERGGYKARGSKVKDVKAAVAVVEEKAKNPETPPPAPPRTQGAEKERKVHPWVDKRPTGAKVTAVCPMCGRNAVQAALWRRFGIICMGCTPELVPVA